MPYRNSPLNPRAGKPGKLKKPGKNEIGIVKDGKGRDVTVNASETKSDNFANCDKCGSLGGYLDPADARRAETMHKTTAHPDSVSVEAQKKRNWHGETVRDRKNKRG